MITKDNLGDESKNVVEVAERQSPELKLGPMPEPDAGQELSPFAKHLLKAINRRASNTITETDQ